MSATIEATPARAPAEVAGLCEQYMPLAKKLANRERARFPSLGDELESAALEGLWKAAREWDAARSKFVTFAHLLIYQAMGEVKDRERKRPDSALNNEKVEAGDLVAVESDNRAENAAFCVDVLLGLLPDHRAEMIRRHYLNGETWEELGGGAVTGANVRLTAERDLAMLREVMGGEVDTEEVGGEA